MRKEIDVFKITEVEQIPDNTECKQPDRATMQQRAGDDEIKHGRTKNYGNQPPRVIPAIKYERRQGQPRKCKNLSESG